MSNELLLILSVFLIYATVLIWFVLFGKKGIICWTVLATIAANIEALILIEAFSLEQTLGNILFASTFLVTDIVSELYSKKEATTVVNIGIATSISFVILSQSWLLYTPSPNDFISPSIQTVFSNTPRLMLASLIVYAIVQRFDVFLYHKWWELTKRLTNSDRRFLWLRNNGSTLISQLLNTVLFTFGAFLGTYDIKTLISISFTSYIIFIFTSILDTPVVYLARFLNDKGLIKE